MSEKAKVKIEPKPEVKLKSKVEPEVKVENTLEVKKERFQRVAVRRTNSIIDKLTILGKITQNPQNYHFTKEQIENMFLPIETLTEKIKNKFFDCIGLDEQKKEFLVTEL